MLAPPETIVQEGSGVGHLAKAQGYARIARVCSTDAGHGRANKGPHGYGTSLAPRFPGHPMTIGSPFPEESQTPA